MKSCFFIGHREISEEIFSAITEAVEHHIVHCGVTEFIVGNYGGFDRMAARAVISAKALYPGITLLLLLSYHPAERPIETPPGFDGTFYPPGMESVLRRYAIVRANRHMIDHVDYLIAYIRQRARSFTENAKRRLNVSLQMQKKNTQCVSITKQSGKKIV